MGPDEAPWHRRALLAPDDSLLNAGLSSRGFALLLDSEADAAAVEGGEDNAAVATDTHSWRCDMADRLGRTPSRGVVG